MLGLEAVIPALSKVVSGGMAVVGLNRLWNIELKEPETGVELNPSLNPGLYGQNVFGEETQAQQPAVIIEGADNREAVLAQRLSRAHDLLDQELGLVTDLGAEQTVERMVHRGENPEDAARAVAERHRDGAGEDSTIAMHAFVSVAMDATILAAVERMGSAMVSRGLITEGTAVSAENATAMLLRPEVFVPAALGPATAALSV